MALIESISTETELNKKLCSLTARVESIIPEMKSWLENSMPNLGR